MATTATDTSGHPRTAYKWQVPLLVAIAVWGVGRIFPWPVLSYWRWLSVRSLPTPLFPERQESADHTAAAKFMLRLGVALLGLRLAISDITQLGFFGVLLVIVTVTSTFQVTRLVGIRLGLEPRFVSLIASGFAICGAAAIAAIQDSVKAKENLVGLALALVTIHGTVMLALIPLLGGFLGLDDEAIAIWAGASIHEVAQVAAAAALIGPGALAIAMGVKLGRVLMLAPVHHAVSSLHQTARGPFLRAIPWFLYAFAAAVLVRATGFMPEAALGVASHSSNILLAAGMFGLGLGLVLKDLWPVPGRAVVLSFVATQTLTSVPLLMLLVSEMS